MSVAGPSNHVERARELAARLLVPQAEQTDVDGVRREVVDAIAAAGLLGLAGPCEYGGADAAAAVQREVTEILAGACGATWFVCTQHTMPVLALTRSANRDLRERRLREMCTGQALAGIAIAHVRRPGAPAVTATRTGNGWRFDGHVAWTTSWGIADLLFLAGVSPSGELVQALIPARDQPGLRASGPMRLAAMQATATVTLELDGLPVAEDDIVEIVRLGEWLESDRLRTCNAAPAGFGLLRRTVALLAEEADRRDNGTAARLALRLGDRGEELRSRAYALVDQVSPSEQIEDRLALRAAALELTLRATTALVALSGGGAMSLSAAPQRLAREALFHLVQMQTGPVREATLQHFLTTTG